MRRRETYGTSGPRHQLRFFAGRYSKNICDDPELVATAYRGGVPMGAETGLQNPTFAVLAMKDPGDPGNPGTPLQRVQIVKGWVDKDGDTHEAVYDVAGETENGADVDLSSCAATGSGGHASLCTVWQDPKFDASERAFYYARVIENPVCRWSTRLCNDLAVDCTNPGSVPAMYSECCGDLVDKAIQERAWTSPIFYQPEGFGVKGKMKLDAALDDMKLQLLIGRVSSDIDVTANDLTINIADDDAVYTATLPAGTLIEKKPGRAYIYKDPAGALAGIKTAVLKISSKGTGKLKVNVKGVDLGNADASTHQVSVQLVTGAYDHTDRRSWAFEKEALTAEQ
jgi:hypothetical protein